MSKAKRYRDVVQLVRAVSEERDFADKLEERVSQRQLVKMLFACRSAKGLSQRDIAAKLKCTQSRVSKLESTNDADLRLGDLCAYTDALGLELRLVLARKNGNSVGEVKYHAFAIKRLLDRLAHLAAHDEKIAEGVSGFFGEAFFNLVRILQDASKRLPKRPRDSTPYILIELQEESAEHLEVVGKSRCGGEETVPNPQQTRPRKPNAAPAAST